MALVKPKTSEDVESPIAVSSILAAASRARFFFDAGAWPTNVFCNVDVFNWFRRLPPTARDNKTVARLLLLSRGLSNFFVFPLLKENFEDAFVADFQSQRLAALFDAKSRLYQFGIIDNKLALQHLDSCKDALTLLRMARMELRLRELYPD